MKTFLRTKVRPVAITVAAPATKESRMALEGL